MDNSCVGDEYELQIECWNCSHYWIIFRFAAEKEMSAKCPQCGMWNKRALRQALADTEIIEAYLNSTAFEKHHITRARVRSALETWLLSEKPRGTLVELIDRMCPKEVAR